MAKQVHDNVLDAAYDYLLQQGNKMTITDSEPTSYADALSYALASFTMYQSDYAKANGDTSGRKCTVGAKTSGSVTDTGSARWIALVGTTLSLLLYVTSCTTQSLTAGNTVNTPAWDIEIADPV